MSDMNITIDVPGNPPPAVRRRRATFFSGQLVSQSLVVAFRKQLRDPLPHKARDSRDDRPRGDSRGPSRRARRIEAEIVLARVSRKDRNRLLQAKCRAAGVRNAAGLALRKAA